MFKSGFVSVVGRSNVGKSSILNKIIGEQISIVSSKAQTTRKNLKLIYNDENSQIIFIDTPGFQKPKNELGKALLNFSKKSLDDTDLILYIVDCNDIIGQNERDILKILKNKNNIILVINKIDIVNNDKKQKDVLKLYEEELNLKDYIFVSAKTGENIINIVDIIKKHLPEGPEFYPKEYITDISEREIVSDIIRMSCLNNLQDEIPHGINVEIEKMKKRANRDIYDIEALIVVERENHKGMVIGKGGNKLKKINTFARKNIEVFLNARVNLKVLVKVDKDWREKQFKVREFGYR